MKTGLNTKNDAPFRKLLPKRLHFVIKCMNFRRNSEKNTNDLEIIMVVLLSEHLLIARHGDGHT